VSEPLEGFRSILPYGSRRFEFRVVRYPL
jgi:hypothetical protein